MVWPPALPVVVQDDALVTVEAPVPQVVGALVAEVTLAWTHPGRTHHFVVAREVAVPLVPVRCSPRNMKIKIFSNSVLSVTPYSSTHIIFNLLVDRR